MTRGGRSRPSNRSGLTDKNKPPAQRKTQAATAKPSTAANGQVKPIRAIAPAAQAKHPVALPKAAEANATPAKPLSPFERGVSAFTRGFPYALAEYCLFLLAAYAGAALAIVAGALVVLLAGADSLLQGKVSALLPADWLRETENLLGRRRDVIISLGVAGLGLILWAVWNLSSAMFFSWLAICALIGALFLMLYAQWNLPAKGSETA